MELIASLADVRGRDAGSLGTKAANLGDLLAAGFRVPTGFVVTASAYDAGRGVTVPSSLRPLLATAYTKLGRQAGERDPRVAVRSSVIGEDENGPSYAGVYESVTNVRGVAGVADAVERCWASLHGDTAVAYRAVGGVDAAPAMAVLVQLMVPVVTSGTIFTIDPTGRDPNIAVLEASFGQAEAIVNGLVEPDTYVVARTSGHLLGVRVGSKAIETVTAPMGETTVAVDPTRRRTRVLTRAQVADVARLAFAVEHQMGAGQEVEWGYDGSGNLFVLQARPVRFPLRGRADVVADGAVMALGTAASTGVATGWARVMARPQDAADEIGVGDVLVVEYPSLEWLPVLDRVTGVVTDRGGITGHLAVACRELGLPCVVGTRTATATIRDGDFVAVDGISGVVRAARSHTPVMGDHP